MLTFRTTFAAGALTLAAATSFAQTPVAAAKPVPTPAVTTAAPAPAVGSKAPAHHKKHHAKHAAKTGVTAAAPQPTK